MSRAISTLTVARQVYRLPDRSRCGLRVEWDSELLYLVDRRVSSTTVNQCIITLNFPAQGTYTVRMEVRTRLEMSSLPAGTRPTLNRR